MLLVDKTHPQRRNFHDRIRKHLAGARGDVRAVGAVVPLPGGQGARRGHRLGGVGRGRRRDRRRARDRLDGRRGPGAAEAAALPDPDDIQKELRPEATRLFVGAPEAACSPYEGVWRAKAEGVQPLLFVNPHSMAVERFCKACGLGRPEGTNEPLDAVWTELELLEYLALRAAADAMDAAAEADVEAGGDGAPTEEQAAQYKEVGDEIDEFDAEDDGPEPGDVVASADLPGGSPEAAWDEFMAEHAKVWMPQFAEACEKDSRVPFYKQAASLLGAFIK